PSNIFLCGEDSVVLGDLSLPVQGAGVALDRLSYDYRYAAPELFRGGGAPGPQADLYSLGCVAYELACGVPPFEADNHHELAARHLHETIVLPSRRGDCFGGAGDALLLKLLARSAADRYPTLQDLLGALDSLERFFLPAPGHPGEVMLAKEVLPPAPLLHDASLIQYQGAQSVLSFDQSAASLPGTLGPAPAPESSPGPPPQIGKYDVLGTLGKGGMGVVYQARDRDLDRIVALKVLRHRLESSAERMTQRRLQREALAFARLRHPNIVGIYEIGEDQGQSYLA